MLRFSFVLTMWIVIFGISGCGVGDESESQSHAMLTEDLHCPEGSKGEYERWGGIDSPGWAHSCKMNHGKYHVWKGDILVIEGQFDQGKKEGVWIFRDDNGQTTKTVEYRNGIEL